MKAIVFALIATIALNLQAKTGVVDLLVLVRNHPDYESNKEILLSTEKNCNKRIEVIKTEAEDLQKEGKMLADEYRNPMLSAAAKAKIEADLTQLQQKLYAVQQRFQAETMNARRELQDLEAVMLKKQTEKIRKKIMKFAEREGYEFIVDKSAVCYFKPSADVTDLMLKELGVDPAKAKKPGDEKDESK